jgi:hypothetical protein
MRAMLKRENGKKKRVPKQIIITGLKLITETDFNFCHNVGYELISSVPVGSAILRRLK